MKIAIGKTVTNITYNICKVILIAIICNIFLWHSANWLISSEATIKNIKRSTENIPIIITNNFLIPQYNSSSRAALYCFNDIYFVVSFARQISILFLLLLWMKLWKNKRQMKFMMETFNYNNKILFEVFCYYWINLARENNIKFYTRNIRLKRKISKFIGVLDFWIIFLGNFHLLLRKWRKATKCFEEVEYILYLFNLNIQFQK